MISFLILSYSMSVQAQSHQGQSHQGQCIEVGTGIPVVPIIRKGNDDIDCQIDSSGIFTCDLSGLDDGDIIVVEAKNYQSREIPISDFIDTKIIWLRPELPVPEIVVESKEESFQPFRQMLDKEKVEHTPGTHDDPIRLLQSLGGSNITPEYAPSAGSIILRNSDPMQSRILVDGVDLPYLYHFQQYASVIHTRMLSNVSLYPSAFDTQYGNVSGGMIDVETQIPNEQVPHIATNINFVMAGLYASVPVQKGVVSTSARGSFAHLYEDGNDQYSNWPKFYDYLLRYDVRDQNSNPFSVTLMGAGDTYTRALVDTERLNPFEQTQNPNFTFDRDFHILSLQSRISTNTASFHPTIALGYDSWNGTLDFRDDSQEQRRSDLYFWVRSPIQWIVSDVFQISTGIEGRLGQIDYVATADESYLLLEREAPLLAFGTSISQIQKEQWGGFWLEPKIQLGAHLIGIGARVDGQKNYEPLVQPRLNWQYRGDRLNVRSAVGLYHQFPTADWQVMFGEKLGSEPIESQHIAIGIDGAVAQRWELELNGWGRNTENLPRLRSNGDLLILDSQAYGIEFLSRYRLKDRFFSWVSVGWSHIEEWETGQVENAMEGLFSQPLNCNFVASWRPNVFWNVAFRYRLGSGNLYYDPVDSIFIASEHQYQPVYTDFANARLPNYQKLDMHLSRHWFVGRTDIVGYAEMWFVPSRSNYLYPTYNFDYRQSTLVKGPPIFPLLGIRIQR